APLTPGLQLVGRVGVSDAGTTSAQIGVQVDFGRFGVRTAAAFPGSGGTGSQLAVVRLSSVQYPGLSIPRDRSVQVDLDDALRRPSSGLVAVLLGQTHRRSEERRVGKECRSPGAPEA